MAGSLDISFGGFFLKAPFCPQKGASKGLKQPVFSLFCNYINGLLRSDPESEKSNKTTKALLRYGNMKQRITLDFKVEFGLSAALR